MILRRFKSAHLSPELILEGENAHHLLKVLRVKKGDTLEGFDGKGNTRLYKIQSSYRKRIGLLSSSEIVSHPAQEQTCFEVFLPLIRKDRAKPRGLAVLRTLRGRGLEFSDQISGRG